MRRIRIKRRFAGIALITAAAMLLAGCAAPSTGSEGGSAGGNELRAGLGDSITNLYPGIEAGVANYWVAATLAEGLVTVDADGQLQPALATSWEQTSPTSYVFEIDSEASFQDGTPLTMDDVLASIEAARNPEISPSIVTWPNVDRVEQTGDWQLTITLLEPDASFIYGPSASAGLFVFPASYWQSAGDKLGTAEALPVGTGPYQVTAFSPDSSITLKKSEHWDGPAAAFDSLVFEIIPEANTMLLAMQSGKLDLALSVPVQQVKQWEGNENFELAFTSNRSYTGLTFDAAVAPFNDKLVRDAVAHAFDRAGVVEQVLGGHGEVATAMLTPDHLEPVFGDNSRAMLAEMPQYEFDLAAAKRALDASSAAGGFTTELVYPSAYPELGLAAELLKQNLAEIGVTLETRGVPTNEWFSTMGDRVHGIGFMSYFSTTADPAEMSNWLLGPDNLASLESPEVTAALAQARAAETAEDQLRALIEANRAQAEANAYAPLWWGEQALAISNDVKFEHLTSFALFTSWPLQLSPAKA